VVIALAVDGAAQGHLWIGELNAIAGFFHHHQRLQAAAVATHNQAPALLANGQTQLMVPIPRGEGIRAQAPMACGIHLHGSG
tara:strand:+ start:602 stop:847 length:246 start_codon:yes stop_codon:yes gene_type:complete